MNQKFKSGKKVLSLVLSVLMLMSCLVFAPVANAAETLPETTFQFLFECTDPYSLDRLTSDYPTVYSFKDLEKCVLTVEYADGHTDTINLIWDNGTTIVNDTFTFLHEKWEIDVPKNGNIPTFTRKSSSKITGVKLNQKLSGRYGLGALSYTLTVKANGNVLGTYFGDDYDVNNEYIIGGDSGNTITASKASAIKFTEKVTSATIDNGSADAQFPARVVDQFGVAMSGKTVTYSVIMDMLKNNDIEDNLVAAPDNGYDEQPIVDAAADALELFLEELNKKIDDNDPDVIKYYTVKFNWHDGSSEKKYVKGATVAVPTVGSYVYGGFTYEFTGWDKAVVAVDGDAEYKAQYTEPRSMDDVIEAEKKADDIIGNKDYYEEDRKAVEDAKKELDEYLDETGVVIDENGNVTNNPVAKDSEEDAKITELVQKLNDAINTANKNKEERDKAFNKTSGFLGWLTRLLILVRHLLNMV